MVRKLHNSKTAVASLVFFALEVLHGFLRNDHGLLCITLAVRNSGHPATRWSSTADPHALQMNAWVKQSNALEVHPEPSKSTSLKSSKASYEQATSHHNNRSKEAPEQDTSSYNCQHIAQNLEVTTKSSGPLHMESLLGPFFVSGNNAQ